MHASRPLTAIAVALLLGGCHRLLPGSVPCPAAGGPQWREYHSKHFVVDTDLDREAARDLVAGLEKIEALMTTALVGAPRDIPGYVRVVVPAQPRMFFRLAPFLAAGFFKFDALGEPTIVVHPAMLREDPEVLAHELAHHFTWYFFPRQPLWFAEGIAQFVQTVASDKPLPGAAGVVPRIRARALRDAPPIAAKDLLRWRGGGDGGLYELWCWVLYHWLWNNRSRQLSEFQRRLGEAEDPAAAWTAAFPEFDPADSRAMKKLDAALQEHRHRGELVYYQVTAQVDAAYTEAPLSAADVHFLLMDVEGSYNEHMVTAALQDDPLHPLALAARAGRDKAAAARMLRGSAAARPGDWRTWLLLGFALEGDAARAEREAAFRKAIELNSNSASAHNGLASALATSGHAGEALPFARRAVELEPAAPPFLDTLAKIALELDACDDAVRLQRRAVDLRPGKRGEELRLHLHAIEERCRVPKSGDDPR